MGCASFRPPRCALAATPIVRFDDLGHVILEIPTDTITVYVAQTGTDSYGNTVKVPSTEGVEIGCRISPQSNTRDRVTSRVETTYKVITGNVSTTRWIRV